MTDVSIHIRNLRSAPRMNVLRPLEFFLAGLILFLVSQGLLGPLLADTPDPEGADILRVMWLPVYALTIGWMVITPARTLEVLWRTPLILTLSILCFVSFMWSVDAGLTQRRGFALVMTTLFGLLLASRFNWRELITLFAVVFVVLGVMSAVMSLAFPGIAVHHDIHVGAWKGIWWEKNTLGAMMAFGTTAALAASVCQPRHKMIWWGLAAFQAGLVLMSTSKTALLALMLALAGIAAIHLIRRGFGFSSLILIGGGLVVFIVVLMFSIAPVAILEALGRDATLTGRTDIWLVLADQIQARPWTGYGYGAFWDGVYGPAYWVRQRTQWPVPTAHNGWLEIALGIGLPGIILMAMSLLISIVRAAGRLFRGPEVFWALIFLILVALISISESNLLQRNAITWVLFVATAARLALPRRYDDVSVR
ncbi:O-antigen ligase family protein [Hyphobacterium sp. CCMP332]|uniref:O-antigen ligase family protein n=1 Tax=Hyphobacterium sp. CCMP332 TaxID=2749086 RepID=UPI00164F2A62|nr:O-antigen ligase family protein [Hyphobacterium sp. CCMP332]QNL18878.1 O-antigen ligase family protein [Hyphobacterium sp. CCMP332]